METEVIWAQSLPPGTSAQRAELIALTQALIMRKELAVSICLDNQHAFATAHVHEAIDQEQGLLTAEGKTIKNEDEILQLLRAKKMAITRCPGYQKGMAPVAKGDNLTDKADREVGSFTANSHLCVGRHPTEPPSHNC